MTTVYAIASAKGGVGKTTTTAALAAHLADAGEDVVAVDADIGMANLAGALGIDVGETTIHDVLAGRADPEEAVHEGPNGLSVLPGETDLDAYAEADPAGLRDVIAAFEDADFLLIDAGAGLSHDSALPLGLADETLLVSTTGTEALRDTRKTGELAERLGGAVAGAAITRVDPDDPPSDDGRIAELIGEPILGRIPEDAAVPDAVEAGEPLSTFAPTAPATRAYRSLASELTGVDVPEVDPDVLEADEEPGSTEDEGDEGKAEAEDDDSEAKAADDGSEAEADSPAADPENGSTAHVEMTSGDLSDRAEEGESAEETGDPDPGVPPIDEAEPDGSEEANDDENDESTEGSDDTGESDDMDDMPNDGSGEVESVPFQTAGGDEKSDDEVGVDEDDDGSESEDVSEDSDGGAEDDDGAEDESTGTEPKAEPEDGTEGDDETETTTGGGDETDTASERDESDGGEDDESDDGNERKGFFSRLLGR
jgi:septum site-determining protein MinD